MKEKQIKKVEKYFEEGAMRVALFVRGHNRVVLVDEDGTVTVKGGRLRRHWSELPVEEIRPVYIGDGYDLY